VVIVDAVVSIAIRMGEIESYATVSRLAVFWDRFGSIPSWFGLIAIGSFFASISFKSGTAVSPDAKRRLRLLFVGTTVSLTPALLCGSFAVTTHNYTRKNVFLSDFFNPHRP
jgi:hypothetical protein